MGKYETKGIYFCCTVYEGLDGSSIQAALWRTMILASLDQTLFPYSKYIRTLNLHDLEVLFQDAKFRTKLSR